MGKRDLSEYHLAELQIACDPSDWRHASPPAVPAGQKVLDVGCGAGQTLIAGFSDRLTYGVDVDFDSLRLGKTLTDRIAFVCAKAEALPFCASSFDFAIARVSLPYTNILTSLTEIRRVLKPGGCLWAALERFSLPFRIGAYKNPKFYLFLPYLLLNSALFHFWGRSVPFLNGRYSGYQTAGGIKRALVRAGFHEVSISRQVHLIVMARS